MGLFRKAHRKHVVPAPHRKKSHGAGSRFRICRFEQMESRQLLSATIAPIHVATTYFEDSNDYDQSSVLQGTQHARWPTSSRSASPAAPTEPNSTQLTIDPTTRSSTRQPAAPGVYGYFPLTIVSHDGFEVTSSSVVNGGTQLVLTFSGFQAGEKLVFSIDVDENGNLEPNAVVEGAEFEGATLTGSFTAPHMQDITTPGA